MRVLIVDDDTTLSQVLRDACAEMGHEGVCVHQAAHCLPAVEAERPALVVLDVRLRDGNGLELLREIKSRVSDTPVAVMSGFEPLATASHASARGADYFLRKPFGVDEFTRILTRVEKERASSAASPEPESPQLGGVTFVGASRAMMEACRAIGLAARSGATTLIEGESGVGKELAARAIHALGGAQRPFAAVDCSTFVEALFESELFGHERGAFTGAYVAHAGKVETARGGVLFLDEISELTPRMQSKLLRLLQERTYERVGGTGPIPVDFQVVAATNQPLKDLVLKDKFRADLLYRLHVLRIHLPPLRERREDIPLLVRHFLRTISRRQGVTAPDLTPAAQDLLFSYEWPGNVRELDNVILRCVLHSPGSRLDVPGIAPFLEGSLPARASRKLAEIERDAIQDALRACDWNLGQVCSTLGISRPTLRRKMRRHRLNAFDPRKRGE